MNISHCPSTQAIPLSVGRSMRLTMVILALLTALGACGGDDDVGSATTDPPASTTSTPTTTTQPPDTSSTLAGAGEDVFG